MQYRDGIKRIVDFFASSILLLLCSPLLFLLTIVLSFVNKGKPFFFQERPGKGGKLFKIIKFKTMRDLNENEVSNKEVHSLSRITKVGHFIRKYSLDELLQFVNVFKGDMSLVGPRPLLVEYLPLYNKEQSKRHDIRPGITGWAQVNGRNALTWKRKFELDVWYVGHLTFFLDIKILFLTAKKVFVKEGVNADKDMTMEVWQGNFS